MTITFMGGEMGAFVPSDALAVENTSNYNAAFARCNLAISKVISYAESPDIGTGTDLWCHFDMSVNTNGQGSTENGRFVWLDGSGTEVVRLVQAYDYTLRMEYWNGSAWTAAATEIAVDMGTRQTIDIHVVCNSASGSIKLYLSGTLRIDSGSIDLSGITSLGKIRFKGGTISGYPFHTYASQCIVSTTSTVGGRLFTFPVSGGGATSSWTGSYAEIDEAVCNDADFINSTSANQVSTFAVTAASLTGYQVQAVAVTARAKCGSGGPQNLQLAIRSAGTNYFSSSKALDAGYGAFINIWETDPATSSAWVNTAVVAAQPGVKSIT